MVISTQQPIDLYSEYTDPKGRISRNVDNWKLFPIPSGFLRKSGTALRNFYGLDASTEDRINADELIKIKLVLWNAEIFIQITDRLKAD